MISLADLPARFATPSDRGPIPSRTASQPAGALPYDLLSGRALPVDAARLISDPVLREVAVAEAEIAEGHPAPTLAA